MITRVGTFKGWFYVLATGGLLYLLIRRADEALERRARDCTRELSTLLAVSNLVVSTLELEPLLKLVLDQLWTVVDYSGASVMKRKGEQLIPRAHRGPFSQEEASAIRFSVQQPLAGEVVLKQKSVVIDDTSDDAPRARDFHPVVPEAQQSQKCGGGSV